MVSDQFSVEKKKQSSKYRLRYEAILKAMPPDIRQELAKRKLEEISNIECGKKAASRLLGD